MNTIRCLVTAALIALLIAGTARSEVLAVDFFDPVGDPTGGIDVVSMSLIFDTASGEYSLILFATEAQPFFGSFRLNIHLYDVDRGVSCADALLKDTLNDFDLAVPSREVVLTGTSTRLMAWQIGDRVATNTTPFGNPDCSGGFSSSVVALPFQSPFPSDAIADGDTYSSIYAPHIFSDGFEDGTVGEWSAAVP